MERRFGPIKVEAVERFMGRVHTLIRADRCRTTLELAGPGQAFVVVELRSESGRRTQGSHAERMALVGLHMGLSIGCDSEFWS